MKKIFLLLLFSFILFNCSQENPINEPKDGININLEEKTDKKTYIGFVSTTCPHCIDGMPILDNFYKDYKSKVNMQMIVIDGKIFNGNYSIPQDISNPLTFEQATGEECGYIPSYVIYDENKKIVEKKCGGSLTHKELEQKLLNQEDLIEIGNLSTNTGTTMNNEFQTEAFKQGDIGIIMTTSNGKIEIKLFPQEAPKTVTNFLTLSKNGYYNNLIFHRVEKDFMIQGGDPEGTGVGGESIYGKSFEDEFSDKLSNIRGGISMANSGPNTNGSQFFINHADNVFLDSKHTVFGQVITGIDNIDKIASVKTDDKNKPLEDIKIIKIEIVKFESGTLKPYDFNIKKELIKIDELDIKRKKEIEAKKLENKNRVVKAGDKIAVNYILKTSSDKKEFDNSYTRGQPLELKVGAGEVMPGFDMGVVGMKIGDKKTLNLKASEGYGEYDEKNIQEVNKSELKDFEDNGIKIEVGEKLPTMYGEFEIKEVLKDSVKVDLNHFLAGKDLIIEIEIVDFKD